MVCFSSDNGFAAHFRGLCSCSSLRGGKLSYYEGGMRVLFLLRWPDRVKTGLVFHEPVSLFDLFPTSVAAAGAKLPADRVYDGVDLMPYLSGKRPGSPKMRLPIRNESTHCSAGPYRMRKNAAKLSS